MAAPQEMTTRDISGTFVLNKSLSDNGAIDTILSQQGISWLIRKAIGASTLTLTVLHTAPDGVEHIDIDLRSTFGGNREERVFDWTERGYNDTIFGHVLAKSRRVRVEDVEEPFLRDGWTDDTAEHGLIDTYAESDTPKSKRTWKGRQTWGFEVVGGERRYSRHVYFTGPQETVTKCRMVYDYQGA